MIPAPEPRADLPVSDAEPVPAADRPDQAPDGSPPAEAAPPPAAPADPGAGLQAVLCLLAILVGLALRLGHGATLDGWVGEWETDGFVMAYEGRPWDADNRVRAPGHGLLLGRLAESLPDGAQVSVRWLSVGLSLLALLAAFQLVASASRATGMGRRSVARGCAFVATLWAVHPTLIRAAVSPTPESLTGGALCLLVAGLCRLRVRPGLVGWLGLTVGAALSVLVGGSVVALALVIGLLVYLLPVPRVLPALGALSAVVLALAAGWFVQRGPDPGRPVVPDTAPVHALLALTDTPPPHPNDAPIDADVRAVQTLERAGQALGHADPLALALELARRAGPDLLGPRRLVPLLRPGGLALFSGAEGVWVPNVLGLWDVFLRGGLLLFALAVVGMARRKQEHSSWPRAGLMVGLVSLVLLSVAGAVGPLAMAPVDLLLLGAAGGGMAAADPRRPWTRRLAFAVGGVLLCTFLITAGVEDQPLTSWTRQLTHHQDEGALLVDILDDGGPDSALARRRAATLLTWPGAPFLRRPTAALVHALEATKLDPEDGEAVELLIRAQAEVGDFAQAARLAEGAQAATQDTFQAKTFELLLDWVLKEQRDARVREG